MLLIFVKRNCSNLTRCLFFFTLLYKTSNKKIKSPGVILGLLWTNNKGTRRICCSPIQILPSSNDPKCNTEGFLPSYCRLCALIFDYEVLGGDFNSHVDNLKDGNAKELWNLMDKFGLYVHVTDSMHNKGHLGSNNLQRYKCLQGGGDWYCPSWSLLYFI